MTGARTLVVAGAVVLLACGVIENRSRASGTGAGSSPPATARPPAGKEVVRTFPAAGVTRLVFRASRAKEAGVTRVDGDSIVVSGQPRGGAAGYHPADPTWRETAAQDWGLDFRSKVVGSTLVLSSWNEIRYIHHGYYLDNLAITVPKDVEVVLEARQLSGDGRPDLRDP